MTIDFIKGLEVLTICRLSAVLAAKHTIVSGFLENEKYLQQSYKFVKS